MKILEFGDSSKKIIILIHGFQCPWQVWEKYIEYYKNDFRVIVPVMSGHDPDGKEDFISFASDAEEIEDYVLSHYGNQVFAVYGMSMGGVLAAVLWQNQKLLFDKVIFDGSPLVSCGRLMRAAMKKFYVDVTHKSQRRDKKTVERAAETIVSKDNLGHFLKVLDCMSDATIKNSIDGIADFKLRRNVNTPDTAVFFFHGTAFNELLAGKSAEYVRRLHPNTMIKCFKGKFHCENVLFDPERMIEELNKIFLEPEENI